MSRIRLAETDDEYAACYRVTAQLRPHLDEADFVQRVRLQNEEGYRQAYLQDGGAVLAVAGFRVLRNLFSGHVLYVDDLVVDESARSQGLGHALFAWLVEHATSLGCVYLELDSGVQRSGAHRFYMREGMEISSFHFRLRLPAP